MAWLLTPLIIAGGYLAFVTAQNCIQDDIDDYCKCTTSDGSVSLDIREMGLKYPVQYEDTEKMNMYYYAPCQMKICGTGDPSSTVCQEALNTGIYFSCGRYIDVKWTITNADPNSFAFEISYGGGDATSKGSRSSVIRFSKETSPTTAFKFDEQVDLTYKFSITGPSVGPSKKGGGKKQKDDISGPVGIVLILLTLIALVTYFVVGGIYMYKKKGARGLEVIPNYAFWKDLPFLIKDGFFFTISPCYKRSEKNMYQTL